MKLELRCDTVPIPHCCNCGKAIAKKTHCQIFGVNPDSGGTLRTETSIRQPKDPAEIERFTNQRVTSVRWYRVNPDHKPRHVEADFIDRAWLWDGESYVDDLFCTNRCAIAYARNKARIQRGVERMSR